MAKAAMTPEQKQKQQKLLTIGLAMSLFILLVEGLLIWVVMPRLQISQVELDSDLNINDELFYQLSGLDRNTSYIGLNVEEMALRLEEIPQVMDAQVEKRFPNRLIVTIRGRESVALIWKEDLSGQGILAVDPLGVIYPNHQGLSHWDLPVISGIDLASFAMGDRLDSSYELLLQDLESLRQENPAYYNIISEIKLIPQPGQGYHLLVYLTTHEIAARCSLPLDSAKLEKAILVLDVLEKEGMAQEVEEVDIRRGSISYRSREV